MSAGLIGWWCQYDPNGGRGHGFHEDPLEGCPGPHVPCYGPPELYEHVLTVEQANTLIEGARVDDMYYGWDFIIALEAAFPDAPWRRLYWEKELTQEEWAIDVNRAKDDASGVAFFQHRAASCREMLRALDVS